MAESLCNPSTPLLPQPKQSTVLSTATTPQPPLIRPSSTPQDTSSSPRSTPQDTSSSPSSTIQNTTSLSQQLYVTNPRDDDQPTVTTVPGEH